MKPFSAMRRLLANTDRLNELVSAVSQLQESADNVATAIAVSARRLQETADNQATAVNERLDRLQQSADNQATGVNERLDRLRQAAERSGNERLGQLHEGLDNQTRDLNEKLTHLIEATNRQTGCLTGRLGDLVDRLDLLIASGTHEQRKQIAGAGTSEFSNAPAAETEPPVDPGSGEALDAPWLHGEIPSPLPLPNWSGGGFLNDDTSRPREANAMKHYQRLLDALEPWRGFVPKGFQVDFLGILTDAHFRVRFGADPDSAGGIYTTTEIPALDGRNGEWWFETINWLEAAREARGHFVMMTLGASYGCQAVGAHRALQIVNPMPCKLVAVEPVPENYAWTRKHLRDNAIDPDAHWLVNAAISNVNAPIFFPVGAAGSGANNCMSTDTPIERKLLVDRLVAEGRAAATLRNVMLHNRTGVMKDMLPGRDAMGEIQLVSAVTLRDLLSAFDLVDYVEADIQQSEVRVFPPFLDLLKKKVRRIHIGTHGADAHEMLHNAFASEGWNIVFSYPPDGRYESDIGHFELNDGVLTVRNPHL